MLIIDFVVWRCCKSCIGNDILFSLTDCPIMMDELHSIPQEHIFCYLFNRHKSGSVFIGPQLATKAFGESGRLSTWQKDEDTHFELTLGAWTWRAKAFKENYPNWKRVIPERNDTTHYVSFQDDRAEKLQRYLKSIPDDREHNNGVKLSRLPEVPDNLHLESSNGMLFSILAEFDPN